MTDLPRPVIINGDWRNAPSDLIRDLAVGDRVWKWGAWHTITAIGPERTMSLYLVRRVESVVPGNSAAFDVGTNMPPQYFVKGAR